MWTVVKDIVHEDGLRGLFRGLTSTWAREVPGYFLLFGGYHFSRQLLTPHGQDYNDLSKDQFLMFMNVRDCYRMSSMFCLFISLDGMYSH